MKNIFFRRALLPFVTSACLVGILLTMSARTAPFVRASDATLDAALAAIAQATAQAQQTKDAREQDLVNQRATVAALDLAQRRQAATWTAQAQARDAEATQVARTATVYVGQTQVAQTVVALATQQKASANASATSVETTRVYEQAQSDNATRTTQQVQALQTSAAHQTQTVANRQLAIEERDANVRTVGSGLVLGTAALTMLALARWVWTITRPRTVVQVVEDTAITPPPISQDKSPIIERVPATQDNDHDEPPLAPEMPPVRVIIDDDLAAQAQIFNDLLKHCLQDSQDDRPRPDPAIE